MIFVPNAASRRYGKRRFFVHRTPIKGIFRRFVSRNDGRERGLSSAVYYADGIWAYFPEKMQTMKGDDAENFHKRP